MTTSGSDTEFHRRRVYVEGLPPKIGTVEVRSIFEPFGTVTFVHLSRAGNGFVTFEDEDAANRALELHGTQYRDALLIVQPESEAAMPLPIVAVKRDINFPKTSVGKGNPQYKLSIGSSASYRSSNSVPGALSSSSRQARSGARGQRLERKSSYPNVVKILHIPPKSNDDSTNLDQSSPFVDGLPERYRRLFCFANFPYVASNIFIMLDTVSLQRSRLVCKEWADTIDRCVINSPVWQPILLDNWRQSNCSIYPLSPDTSDLAIMDNAESRYRNILSFKVDEKEIMLAVDNGNIEIYDRYSMKMTCLLVGQYSASPVKIDFNSNLIFVQYTCAFWRRRQSPSSWWNIYCRKTKKQLRSIDREGAGSFVDLKLYVDDMIYLTTSTSVYAIDVLSSKLQMSKILNVKGDEDTIEAIDFNTETPVIVLRHENQLLISVWRRESIENASLSSYQCQKTFRALPDPVCNVVKDFDEARCQCMAIQVRPADSLAMTLLSNNNGSFEYIGGKPYVLIIFHDLASEKCLRILRLDSNWMNQMSDSLVPFDGESCLITAKFSKHHLAVGFGSFSDKKDGAIAIWNMSELLDQDIVDDEILQMWTVPAPTYHWGGWDGHIGGVNCLHLDTFGLVASNACRHQITTRCIEREDESKKDNLLIYDFWQPGTDARRPQTN